MTTTDTTILPSVSEAGPIETPTTFAPYEAGDGITVIPSYVAAPGMGVLPANAFLVDGPEPVLVDSGPGGTGDGFRTALESIIDPSAIRWLWLTHTDPDHTGALHWLLDAAPQMRVVTSYLAAGKMSMQQPLPMERMYWANPGDAVEIGGRRLVAVRPPTFDAPETVACYDASSSTLFSADTFGALLAAPVETAGEIDRSSLAEGLILWSTIDSPWVRTVDRDLFARSLTGIDGLGASRILGSHLPPAEGMTGHLLELVRRVPDADPWLAPDQQALDAILAQVQD
jgi:glyoxylase-like metal-dependent hydrolase (beta-lactamase superfamily II)